MRLLHPTVNGSFQAIVCGLVFLIVTSCGTGIEVTEHVTDKDVRKVVGLVENRQQTETLEAYVDSLPAWKIGKRFWVADNQVRLLFTNDQSYDLDTVNLAGRTLKYNGFSTGDLYDNRQTVNVMFIDPLSGHTLVYRTGKTIGEFHPGFSVPLLIDMDMVEHVKRQIVGNDYYIRTPIWYDRHREQMMSGRHFIKVHVDSVMPGNSVMPLRVLFTALDSGEKAMVWMTDNALSMQGRDFDALFTATDPRLAYPAITDTNWQRITRGQIEVGMTKEECRLSLGSPKRINERPDQSGMREYWYYDGGSYLFFVDGLLNEYRR